MDVDYDAQNAQFNNVGNDAMAILAAEYYFSAESQTAEKWKIDCSYLRRVCHNRRLFTTLTEMNKNSQVENKEFVSVTGVGGVTSDTAVT